EVFDAAPAGGGGHADELAGGAGERDAATGVAAAGLEVACEAEGSGLCDLEAGKDRGFTHALPHRKAVLAAAGGSGGGVDEIRADERVDARAAPVRAGHDADAIGEPAGGRAGAALLDEGGGGVFSAHEQF